MKENQKSRVKNVSGKKEVNELLKGKRIYLDVQPNKCFPELENQLRALGAIIEKCFSKDVTSVVTSRGQPEDYHVTKKETSSSHTSVAVPSPFSTQWSYDSPTADSPSGSDISKPVTRGQAIAMKASLTQHYGSTNVINCARQWGIKIVHVTHAEKWISRMMENLSKTLDSSRKGKDQHDRQVAVKPLVGAYIKVEDTCRQFRPIVEHVREFPQLTCQAGLKGSPFISHLNNKNINSVVKANKKRLSSCSANKRTDKKLSNTPADKRQCGYCEICQCKFYDLAQHVLTKDHVKFMSDNNNYRQLDETIAKSCQLSNFLSCDLNTSYDCSTSVRSHHREEWSSSVKHTEDVNLSSAKLTEDVKLPSVGDESQQPTSVSQAENIKTQEMKKSLHVDLELQNMKSVEGKKKFSTPQEKLMTSRTTEGRETVTVKSSPSNKSHPQRLDNSESVIPKNELIQFGPTPPRDVGQVDEEKDVFEDINDSKTSLYEYKDTDIQVPSGGKQIVNCCVVVGNLREQSRVVDNVVSKDHDSLHQTVRDLERNSSVDSSKNKTEHRTKNSELE